MNINELYDIIVNENKPFVTASLTDDGIDLNIGKRYAFYQIKIVEDSQRREHIQLIENQEKSFFITGVKMLFDTIDHHIDVWKNNKIRYLKLWLKDLNCTNISLTEPASKETLFSAMCKIPHKENNWLKFIFGLNRYQNVLILYTPDTNTLSVSARDENDNFVMLGIATDTQQLRGIIAQSLKVNFKFDVNFK